MNAIESSVVAFPSDEYALYYQHITSVLSRLVGWYRQLVAASSQQDGRFEAATVQQFVERLLETIRVLRMKHTYSVEHTLKVDVTDSGFPSALEIMNLETDLLRRDDILRTLPPLSLLKLSMLDTLLKRREEPRELLWQASQRTYMTMLNPESLLLTFSPGNLELTDSVVNPTP